MLKRSWRTYVFLLLIGIAFPALLSVGIRKAFSRHQGVQVSAGGQPWREISFSEALRYLWQNGFEGPVELRSYVWIPHDWKRFFILKGTPRLFYFDGNKVADFSQKNWCIGRTPLPEGLHSIVIRLPTIPVRSTPLEFYWTRDYVEAQPIPAYRLYVDRPSRVVLYGTWIAQLLAIIARFNCLLAFLIPALAALQRRIDPAVAKSSLLLWTLLLLMLIIRFYGISYQLEEGIHPDERVVESTAKPFRSGELKPQSYLYTPGFHYMTAGVETLAAWILGQDLPPHLGPRLLTASFSWLSCLLVFSIGTALFPREYAVLSCILFGFSFMPVQLAHFGIIEPAMVFFFLLAFRFFLNFVEVGGRKEFIKAGFASGLAVAVKQTAAIILIPFLSMYVFVHRKRVLHWASLKKIFWWTGTAVLAYLILSPYTLLDFHHFRKDQMFQFKFLSGHTRTALFFSGGPTGIVRILQYLEEGVGYPLLITAAIGCILLWAMSARAFVGLVPVTILFFIASCMARAAPYHYPLLLCPLLALLAAGGVWFITTRMRFRKGLITIVALLLLFPSLTRIAKLEGILAGQDTRRKASEWCYRNLPPGSRIDYELFGPRLLLPVFRTQMMPLFTRGTWEVHVETSVPKYYILDSTTADIFLTKSPKTFPVEHEWYAQLRENAYVIQEFSGTSLGQYNPHIIIYRIRE